MDYTEYLTALSFIVGGFIVGVIVDKILIFKLTRFAEKTRFEIDDVLIKSIDSIVPLWFFLAGVYGATYHLPLSASVIALIHQILLVLIIISITMVLSRIAAGYIKIYADKVQGALTSSSIFVNFSRIIIYLLGFLVILQLLGIPITPLVTALGVGGLAVALALQETLSNLFAGIHILIARNVRIGDYIKLDSGEEGYVADISWRNTSIRALPNNMIVIPNSKLASSILTNYNMPDKTLAVLVQVGVDYGSDLQKVEKVTIEVATDVMKTVQGGVPDFEPFIRYHTFGDSSINFTVILRAKEFVDQYLIKHEFIKRLKKRYDEEGVRIPFPIRTVYMKGAEKE